jgi:hypothetical protein
VTEDRGEYRSLYVALLDDADFRALEPEARLTLITLRLSLGRCGIGPVPGLLSVLSERTGLPIVPPDLLAEGPHRMLVGEALNALRRTEWIQTEAHVVWVVNALRFEPAMKASNKQHRKHVQATYASLPRLAIRDRFRERYADWFDGVAEPHAGASWGPRSSKAEQSSNKAEQSQSSTATPATAAEHPYALACCVQANHSLEIKLGGAYKPLIAAVERDTAEAWDRDGVPLEVALEVITSRIAKYKVTPFDRQPRSLKYFDAAVREAGARVQARTAPTLPDTPNVFGIAS